MAVFKPTASTDDCYAIDDTTIQLALDWNAMGNDLGSVMDTGVRFTNVTIPKNANILTAYVTFRAETSESGETCRVKIAAYDIQDAPTFDTIENFVGMTRTVSPVDWEIPAWTAGTDYDTPSVKTLIQEIINKPLWVTGNDLILFFDDDGSSLNAQRLGRSYDKSSNFCARLTVTYQYGGRSNKIQIF